MPMLCFSTLGCGELDLEDVLALAARRHVPAVELRTLGGHNDLAAYLQRNYGTPDGLRAVVAASGNSIASLDSSVNLIGATDASRHDLLALLPWAIAAGAAGIRVFDGGESGDAAELASVAPLLDWWRDLGTPVTLLIETHDALARPDALQVFLDLYPDANILWDTHHTWKEGNELPAATWARLRGRTSHLHVKDSGPLGHLPPGNGAFPFGELIGALSRDGFDGVISLEWERHWFPELPPLEVALDGFDRVFSSFAKASAR